jgi:GTP-binding protein HflX
LFDRPKSGERALCVHCQFTHAEDNEDLSEFETLARSAGAELITTVTTKRAKPDAKYFIGSGKAEEIRQLVQAEDIELVLVNHSLSPSQERNLERLLKTRVCDRSGLILDIFAARARTFEGQLQVELAQLDHLSTRLVRGWTHLERQKGGIGLRGPGETQLETDRRLLRNRIKTLQMRLEKVRKQRALSRKARQKNALFTISLVGYTNAGKSTLFNRLTEAEIYVADQLFATLDPTSRKIHLSGVGEVILIDTVGFIRHLPHQLVEAFRATLEETQNADLLLHVIDASDPQRQEKAEQVHAVLKEINADDVSQIEIFNKIDCLETARDLTQSDAQGMITRLGVSAQTGEGLEQLAKAVASHISEQIVKKTLQLSPAEGRIRALLYEHDAIVSERDLPDGGWELDICIRRAILRYILPGS